MSLSCASSGIRSLLEAREAAAIDRHVLPGARDEATTSLHNTTVAPRSTNSTDVRLAIRKMVARVVRGVEFK